jgi:hypothetical protein
VRPFDEQSPDHKPGITTSIIKTSMSFSVLHLSWVFSSVFTLYNFMDNFFFSKKKLYRNTGELYRITGVLWQTLTEN